MIIFDSLSFKIAEIDCFKIVLENLQCHQATGLTCKAKIPNVVNASLYAIL